MEKGESPSRSKNRLDHVPKPPGFHGKDLFGGLYSKKAPKEVQEKFSRNTILGPMLMKPKRDDFVAMIRSVHVKDERPFPMRYNWLKAQSERYYTEMEHTKEAEAQEDEEEIKGDEEDEDYSNPMKKEKSPDQAKWDAMRKERSAKCMAFLQAITPEGHTACIELSGFRPYFYVKLKRTWTSRQLELLISKLEQKCVLNRGSIEASTCSRKDFFLFHPDPKEPWKPRTWRYIKLSFPSMKAHNAAASKMRYPLNIQGLPQTKDVLHPEEVFRSPDDHAQRVIDDFDIKPESWIIVEKDQWRFVEKEKRISTCKYEVMVRGKDLNLFTDGTHTHPLLESADVMAPTLVDSFDIECFHKKKDGKIPDPNESDDVCFIIGHSFAWFGSVPPALKEKGVKPREVFLRVSQVVGKTLPVDGVIVEECPTEIDLLLRFRDWACVIMDADILVTYNGDRFDIPFVLTRAKRAGRRCKRFFYMSRIVDDIVELKSKTLSSGALGDNFLELIKPIGRHTMDLFQYIKAQGFRLDQLSLSFVAQTFLKDDKHDVHFQDIFKSYRSTPEDLYKVVAYCAQDCDLPIRLMDNRKFFSQMIEMSRVTFTQTHVILTSGQQVKVFNQILFYAHRQGFVVNMLYSRDYATTEKYGGGTVMDPIKGYYTDFVVTLDFKSLYPTIMMAHNLCYSTLVSDAVWRDINTNHPDYFAKGLKIEEFATAGGIHRFVDNGLGILPMILKTLGEERGKAKKIMNTTDDPLLAAIMNGRQLSLKISANSIYGFTGVKQGRLPCRPIAETTTSQGGRMIMHCKDKCYEWYKAECIYGDSVVGSTPTLLRIDGLICVKAIEDLVGDEDWKPCVEDGRQGKEYCEVDRVEVWSDEGWTPVFRVIRHALPKGSELISVKTPTGQVTCTPNHSLLSSGGESLSAHDLTLSTHLLHHPPTFGDETFQTLSWEGVDIPLTAGVARLLAYFGSQPRSFSPFYRDLAQTCFPFFDWRLQSGCDTVTSTVYPNAFLTPYTPSPSALTYLKECVLLPERGKSFVKFLTGFCKDTMVPSIIFSSPKEVRKGFWNGLTDAKTFKKRYWPLEAAQLYVLGSSVGMPLCVDDMGDGDWKIGVPGTDYPATQVEAISSNSLSKDSYVYDLTTGNNHFQAGVGSLIVHNTDSVMVIFPKEMCPTGVDAFLKGIEAGERLTKEFKDPIEMEMEKISTPFLLKGRKMYAAKVYESVDQVKKYLYDEEVDESKYKVKPPKVDKKGMKPARRDNCHMMRDLCSAILVKLFEKGDHDRHLDTCIDMVKDTVKDLREGKIPVDKLTITGAMRGEYKEGQAIPPHVAVGRRFNYEPGDRVPFVISTKAELDRVQDTEEKKKKEQGPRTLKKSMTTHDCDKVDKKAASVPLSAYARHPSEMEKYKVDKVYYIEKQLYNALEDIFMDRWDEVKSILCNAMNEERGAQQGLQKITGFMTIRPKPEGSNPKKSKEYRLETAKEKPSVKSKRKKVESEKPMKMAKISSFFTKPKKE